MPTEDKTPTTPPEGQDTGKTEKPLDDFIKKIAEDPERTAKEYKDLQAENAKWRGQLRDLEKRVGEFEAAKTKAEQEAIAAETKRLEEQGEWRKLAEQRQAELEQLKTKANQSETMTSFINQMLTAKLEALPEKTRNAINSLPISDPLEKLNWLTTNEALLQPPKPPVLNTAQGGATGQAQVQDAAKRAAELYARSLKSKF